jgi:hypothetical protein
MDKKEVGISFDNLTIKANLSIPDEANALVIFSHGSGSSRHYIILKWFIEHPFQEKFLRIKMHSY